jgi:hypothetical protein
VFRLIDAIWVNYPATCCNALPLGIDEQSGLLGVDGYRLRYAIGGTSSTSILPNDVNVVGGVSFPVAGLVRAFGHGLVSTTKERPS